MTLALYLLLLVPIPHVVEFPLPGRQPEQIERASGFRVYVL